MEAVAKVNCRHQPLHLSLDQHCPFFSKPIQSLSFRTAHPPLSSSSSPFRLSSIRASSSSRSHSWHNPKPLLSQHPQNSPSSPLQTLKPYLKSTAVVFTTAAALFFAQLNAKPAISSPVATPATEETTKEWDRESASLEEQEKRIEEHLARNGDDFENLRYLMEVKIKSRKLLEAVDVVDRLIALQPNDEEWPLLKGQILSFSGDTETARKIFEDILAKDPLRVEAYHGVVMANSESGEPFDGVLKRIEAVMEKCKKEKNNSLLRDFKLLVAQVRVMEEKYGEAIKLYDELVKEEPRDFRPYLCQGIIYTLLKKKDEAEKKFDQFRKLVPKNHPYREYFLDNMFATKFFSEKVERGKAGSSS
ncbi:hypothetical protein K2173_019442 [Erythroxylum novogranatense]|uniref:Chloroplast lumen common family protein n=1 Tax=Erythroxylum novogranatense TaxID=1862640 RepID=A0AAV8UDY6_9ROSI|nr:hypothetical protein K2173_019442 [Erythroxylum novogranatense]